MSQPNKEIETNLYVDNDKIQLVENDPDIFLHKSIILYGSSGSGKTMMIKHILYLLSKKIAQVVVISPTNKVNKDYDNIIPKVFIHDSVSDDLFKNIYQKQEASRNVYDKTSNLNNLYNLFKKCATKTELEEYQLREKVFKQTDKKIDEKVKHISDKIRQKDILKREHEKGMIKFFKHTIRKYQKVLTSKNSNIDLTETDKIVIKYLYYNPNVLLLFDDTAASFKNWGKKTGVTELFFNGRHFYVTTIMSFQNDTTLPPDLRSNAFISIFTTKQCALNFIANKKNCISKNDQKKFEKLIDKIFQQSANYKNHQKMIYFRQNPIETQIQYMIADIHNDFRFGSEAIWELSNEIKKNEDELDDSNEFYGVFTA